MTSKSNIANIRREYSLQSLLESDMAQTPFLQFQKWWDQALSSEITDVNAMTLATCNKDGKPDARIVLLKEFNEEGFTFFTNYNSRKGKELEENPYACIVFFWKELERQVRIQGSVKRISSGDSDEYFIQRPKGSRISAWSSPQSDVITSREILEENVSRYEQQFGDGNIPRPPYWGGYNLSPTVVEFWQGRSNRLHDRIQYTLIDSRWVIERLAP